MSLRQRGFSLLEGLLALALGLMLLAAASQVFVSAVQAWRLQGAVAQLQEDARLVLQRMAQDIRMVGMFGCLRLETADFDDPSVAEVFAQPLLISQGGERLSLIVGQLPGSVSRPRWSVLTDCRSWARVTADLRNDNQQVLALPISRLTYDVHDSSLRLSDRGTPRALIDNVRSFNATRVATAEGERVDVRLTLFEPQHSIEQHYAISVALRNRLPEP
ncbi:type IV pilus assembly protein PilW [Pseudomonas hunanensis]|uniref:Type IV pilus assembly protein PilW n=1 Tax=Pseudomonas hunanensis TaxID=1247546 RepID=A0ACC6K7E7_9PSED|nr:prepilin-type N-terminal cleavage/methylation domain-containing protein [Pseudomonas hunanensis]MDR6714403.1 type IV pilus assembly protein PilW [Pseudomonas hunanensis]